MVCLLPFVTVYQEVIFAPEDGVNSENVNVHDFEENDSKDKEEQNEGKEEEEEDKYNETIV